MSGDPFWLNDVTILVNIDQVFDFFPDEKQTSAENLNSIMRLSLYIGFVLSVYKSNYNYMYIPIICAIMSILIYKNNREGISNTSMYDKEMVTYQTPHAEIDTIAKKTTECTRPTANNPFMNLTMGDMMNIGPDGKIIDKPPACDILDPEIKKESEMYFYQRMYRNATDLFNNQNSQRQFYTAPSTTIPNDRKTFQEWLYKSPRTCKEDTNYCLRYEDVRQKSSNYGKTVLQ